MSPSQSIIDVKLGWETCERLLDSKNTSLKEKCDRYEKALKEYADADNWEYHNGYESDCVFQDSYSIAREALNSITKGD